MILHIESVYGDTILHTNFIEETELRKKTIELLNLVGEKEFPSAFCLRYNCSTINYEDNIKVDYIIDLDTALVYKPIYL